MRRLRPVTAWMRRTVQQVALERLGHLNDTPPGSRCAANEKNHGVREVHGTHGHAYSARGVQARALLGCCLISSANASRWPAKLYDDACRRHRSRPDRDEGTPWAWAARQSVNVRL